MKNHRFCFNALFACLMLCSTFSVKAGNDDLTYTVLFNTAPEGCNLPLIGFFNTAYGNHWGLQAGLINTNKGSFSGLQASLINSTEYQQNGAQLGLINSTGYRLYGVQAGLINSIGNDASFLQAGLINSVGRGFKGAQVGLINSTGRTFLGLQAGLINSIGRELQGMQAGLVNTVRSANGAQLGLSNVTRSMQGSQIGFLNSTRSISGMQLGFLNTARSVSGFQLGFINVARSVSDGVPVGFLSFVREDGLKALEVSLTETHPVNISFKIGVPAFYTFPVLSWNPENKGMTAWGFGCGSYLRLTNRYFFNPELSGHRLFSDVDDWFSSLNLSLGYRATSELDFLVGPSFTLIRSDNLLPYFSLSENVIQNDILTVTGLKVALRKRF